MLIWKKEPPVKGTGNTRYYITFHRLSVCSFITTTTHQSTSSDSDCSLNCSFNPILTSTNHTRHHRLQTILAQRHYQQQRCPPPSAQAAPTPCPAPPQWQPATSSPPTTTQPHLLRAHTPGTTTSAQQPQPSSPTPCPVRQPAVPLPSWTTMAVVEEDCTSSRAGNCAICGRRSRGRLLMLRMGERGWGMRARGLVVGSDG